MTTTGRQKTCGDASHRRLQRDARRKVTTNDKTTTDNDRQYNMSTFVHKLDILRGLRVLAPVVKVCSDFNCVGPSQVPTLCCSTPGTAVARRWTPPFPAPVVVRTKNEISPTDHSGQPTPSTAHELNNKRPFRFQSHTNIMPKSSDYRLGVVTRLNS